MGFHNIEKRSFWYNFLYHYVWFWHNKVFYRKVVVLNYDKVPEKNPLIFTPNHQNALMDALAMLFTVKKQLVFMARADIFKKFAPILYFLKILPIYRIRDGLDSLKKNEEVFNKTIDVLNAREGLVILPEGNHLDKHKLRPLKKGFARIAFQTLEAGKLNEPLQVVPVGIDYDNYYKCRSRLLVNFGDPVNVIDYYDEYKKNPAVALNMIKDELSGRIKKVMINIESDEYYDLINDARKIFRREVCLKTGKNTCDDAGGFFADKKFIEIMEKTGSEEPELMDKMNSIYRRLLKTAGKFKLKPEENLFENVSVFKVLVNIIVLTISFPLFLYGYLNHFFAWQVPYFLSRKVPDKTFHSSFMYVLTMLFFLIFYILQTFLVYSVTGSLQWGFLYLLSLPVSAVLAWKWKNIYVKTRTYFRKMKFVSSPEYVEAKESFNELKNSIDGILDYHFTY